jgi:UDP-3-O-[3-hydroxymyristoyl] glucosamine N-acyltransferase
MEYTVDAIAKHVRGRVIGDGTTRIRAINTLEAAQPGELSFVDGPKRLADALASKASALIVPDGVTSLNGKPGISVANPKLAFALALSLFHPEPAPAGTVHPTAVVGERVQLGAGVTIRAHAVIGSDVAIGRGTVLEAGVVVAEHSVIGEQSWLGPNVVVYRQTRIGNRVRIHGNSTIGGDGFGYVFHEGQHVKVPQVGNVVIEDDVELGCNVCVDRATIGSTIIGRGTKIDNQVQIAHNDRIGQHVIIAGQSGLSGSVTVGDYAVLGGRIGVADHIDIGAGAQAGLCSVITKSVPPKQVVFGYPARPADEAKRQLAALARLPEILRRLVRLEKRP